MGALIDFREISERRVAGCHKRFGLVDSIEVSAYSGSNAAGTGCANTESLLEGVKLFLCFVSSIRVRKGWVGCDGRGSLAFAKS